MKNFILCLMVLLGTTMMSAATSPPNYSLVESDHQVIPQHQQELVVPVTMDVYSYSMPEISYLTGESAVVYTAAKAVLNDMRNYYVQLEKSTLAPVTELPPGIQVNYDLISISKELADNISGKPKRVTLRIRQLE